MWNSTAPAAADRTGGGRAIRATAGVCGGDCGSAARRRARLGVGGRVAGRKKLSVRYQAAHKDPLLDSIDWRKKGGVPEVKRFAEA
uniref:Uncharacterized protein n=1 Tax=Oryza glumipatula TaxID=40148 RepID=A0A0D9ZLQ2_9ORYZ